MTLLDDRDERNGLPAMGWTVACRYDYLIPCRGVGVLLELARLVGVLRQLEADGLVACDTDGLRISNIDALERYADAA